MLAAQVKTGTANSLDASNQNQAGRLLNFLSGALQLMPIELCAQLTPKLVGLAEINDAVVKTKAYLAIEVLFACRRFEGAEGSSDMSIVVSRTLKHLLDNAEVIHSMVLEDIQEGEETKIKIDKRDENRVIAYFQAVTQVLLNMSTARSTLSSQDSALKFVAATINCFSEFLTGSTFKISRAASTAIKMIISHGLSKMSTAAS
mmetsp:Transcript_24172/g.37159  ORF Transcript_24172/g.37159 Transcript_24172/m.37159 type:complete len:203 (+) Transcript_24172:626-1234(+)